MAKFNSIINTNSLKKGNYTNINLIVLITSIISNFYININNFDPKDFISLLSSSYDSIGNGFINNATHLFNYINLFLYDILFILTYIFTSTFFILLLSLYLLTCLYYISKSKKLHFVGFVFFIKFLFTNLVLLGFISTLGYLLFYFKLYTYIYYIPKEIYYNFFIFIMVSYILAFNWNIYNLVIICIRVMFMVVLRIALIHYFPDLHSYFYINLLFLLLPELEDVFQELGNIVFMYSGFNNSGSSGPDNNPMGNNNGGNNGGNSLTVTPNEDNNNERFKDPISVPFMHPNFINISTNLKEYNISAWMIEFKLNLKNFPGFEMGEATLNLDRYIYNYSLAKRIIRPFYLHANLEESANNRVYLVGIQDKVMVVPFHNLVGMHIRENISVAVFRFTRIPANTVLGQNQVKVLFLFGNNNKYTLVFEKFIDIGYFNVNPNKDIYVNTDYSGKVPYNPYNMNHWNNTLFLKKAFEQTYFPIGTSPSPFSIYAHPVIISNTTIYSSNIFRPYIQEFSDAFENIRNIESQARIIEELD